ncbi:SDR family NAD(P)-dependent oxidoreductase [Streptomyces sp. NPDC018031]|uniref:SDR family NAD(P)-dependent oxidoreductase n=1 Tax=Streptomyces sp. NPDC018031 TaxID=3365033 RepID=UPI0037999CA7
MPTALVTGATAGLGKAFTRALAEQGYDLVLVARSERDLKEHADLLQTDHGIKTEILPADLTTDEGCAAVGARVAAEPVVDLLVNNAGIGHDKPFLETGIQAQERLLNLNVRSVLRLTDAALREMTRRRSGTIVNVASVAGLGPTWLSSTYPASKAWIISFTEALAASQEVRSAGVRMMALLPGYTKTEFHQRAGISTSFPPPWLWLEADDVVRTALRDLRRGKVLSIPSFRYKATAWGLRHFPRSLSCRFAWDVSKPGH